MLFSNYFQSILGVFCLVRTVSSVGFNPEVSAADNIGRRPVVLWGVASLAIVTILFGLSPNFTTVIIARALAGAFSGNVAVIPSMLCEITDSSNQYFAFSFFGFWWPLGAIMGPSIGGFLSRPATKHPTYFDYTFFKRFPYFLPCFTVSLFSVVGFFLAFFLLQETLDQQPNEATQSGKTYGTSGMLQRPPLKPRKSSSLRQLMSVPMIRALCASGCALSFFSTAFDVVFVLFCYSPISEGGLAFSISQIGFALAISGAIAALLQVVFMPTILRRVDPAVMYHFCMKLWPCVFLALPFLNIVARRGVAIGDSERYSFWFLWGGIALTLSVARVAFLAYSVNMLLIKAYSPDPASLGSTTALVQFSICFSRAFSPALASAAFTLTSTSPFLGGYTWALLMVLLSGTSCLFSRKIVEHRYSS